MIRYTESGLLVILPRDNPRKIVDIILKTGYDEEFIVSPDFSPDFIARLMKAGFLVMSSAISELESSYRQYILLPKLHITRSALFFENLHIKKSIVKYLDKYELRCDADFDIIVNRCLEIHGEGWLTPPLINAVRIIRQEKMYDVYPMSFALYRDGKLAAGEFGIKVGRIYTSYSGYFEENNAGTVQLIQTTRYLQENGFAFFDLGMPLDYKTDLGAVDISSEEFVKLFRKATS